MARAELIDHPKFKRLRKLLNRPTPHVWGYLECLWRSGCQIGRPMIGDAVDVELAAEWDGESGEFVKAAHESRFIDLVDGSYFIHDLYDHAPVYAQMRLRRNGYLPERLENVGDCNEVLENVGDCNEVLENVGKRRTKGKGKGKGKGKDLKGADSLPTSKAMSDKPPPALIFPVVGDKEVKEWPLTQSQVDEWQGLFPGIDVLAESRKALAWVNANQSKTAKGMKRFLVTWLNKATNTGGVSNGKSKSPPPVHNFGVPKYASELSPPQTISAPPTKDVTE